MPQYRYHIFSCINEREGDDPRGSCSARGAKELQELFKKEVHERGLKKVVRANKAGCLDLCAKGPVVVIYPEGVWYAIHTKEDVLEIVERHLEKRGGGPTSGDQRIAEGRALFQKTLDQYLQCPGADLNTAPFLFSHPEKSPTALLLVHGLAASPWEVLEIGKRAFENGATVYGVRLAGHGTTLEDLASRNYQDWVDSAVEGFKLISHFSDKVLLAGESLGGLIALYLAEKKYGAGVISLAAPLYLKSSSRIFISFFSHFMKYLGRSLSPAIQPYYSPKHSFHALEEMVALSKVVDAGLDGIHQPILIMQSEKDVRVDSKSGRVIYERVGSQFKNLISYEKRMNVPHVMTTFENPLLDEVWGEMSLFLSRVSSQ